MQLILHSFANGVVWTHLLCEIRNCFSLQEERKPSWLSLSQDLFLVSYTEYKILYTSTSVITKLMRLTCAGVWQVRMFSGASTSGLWIIVSSYDLYYNAQYPILFLLQLNKIYPQVYLQDLSRDFVLGPRGMSAITGSGRRRRCNTTWRQKCEQNVTSGSPQTQEKWPTQNANFPVFYLQRNILWPITKYFRDICSAFVCCVPSVSSSPGDIQDW